MRKMVVAVAALLVLTGCSAPVAEETVEPETEQETEIAPAPLVAEQPEETDYSSDDEQFLGELEAAYERRADHETQIPDATDEQLIDAAQRACEQMQTEGIDSTLVQVIDGETPNPLGYYVDSSLIAGISAQVFCPEQG